MDGYCSQFHVEDIDSFVVPLYEKVYFSAEYVNSTVEAVLNDRTFGINALSKLIRKETIIKGYFLHHLNLIKHKEENKICYLIFH